MEVKNYFATDSQGNVLGSAQVYLYLAGTTTLATGLQNVSGAALANPFTSQINGLVQFKAPDADYDLRVVKPGREFTIRIQCFDGVGFLGSISEEPSAGKIPRASTSGKLPYSWIDLPTKSYTLESLGVSSEKTALENATILISAISQGKFISGSDKSYDFEFDGSPIVYSGSVLSIDLGVHLHKFINFGGIRADSLFALQYSGRIDANGSYCKGLGKFRRLQKISIGTLEFRNVFCENPTVDKQFFGLEYSSDTYGDNSLQASIDSIFISNVKTQTYAQSTGLAIPMTIIGNYGSGSSQVQCHQLSIGNFHVEDYYSVDQDGVTPIDGDSDAIRIFTNPTQICIGNIYAKNIAKRFFKTQEEVIAWCGTVSWENDSRFNQLVFLGFFEAQLANSGNPTRFNVGVCNSFQADGNQRPLLFNASGLPHSIVIDDLKYKNIGFYSANQNIGVDIKKAVGSGMSISATSSSRVRVREIEDSSITNINVTEGFLEKFDITFDPSKTGSTNFFLDNLHICNGRFSGWSVNNRVARFYSLKDVQLSYSQGSSYVRGLVPAPGGFRRAEAVRVTDSTGLVTQVFEAAAASSGELAIENFRASGGPSISVGFISSGSWSVWLNNCIPDTFTGAGATVKRLTYV